jgi:hypothetical protein
MTTWIEAVLEALDDASTRIDEEARKAIREAIASGATTPEELEHADMERIARLPPEARAAEIEEAAAIREQLESMLEGSGWTGDLSKLSTKDLADLEAGRQRWDLRGNAVAPTESAEAAAAAAMRAGGNMIVDPDSGAIEVLDDAGKLHVFIGGGQEGPPADAVEGEILGGAERGGPRALPNDLVKALQGMGPGDTWQVTGAGDVVIDHGDGTRDVFGHDALGQFLADLDLAKGNIAGIGDVLGKGATDLGDALTGAITDLLGSFPTASGGVSNWTGMGGTGTVPPGSTTGGAGSSSGSSQPSSGPSNIPTSGRNTNQFDPAFEDAGDDDADDSDDTTTPQHEGGAGAANDPGSPGTDSGGTDGLDFSEIPDEVITGATNPDAVAEDGKREIIGATDDDEEDEEEDDEEEDEADTEDEDADEPDAGYTPRPDDGSGSWRNLTPDQVAALLAAAEGRADARGAQSDRTAVKPHEFDPAFMVAAQERKQSMIGNPGPGGLVGEGGSPTTFTSPPPIPDDDTPGMTPNGHDHGAEDPMQQHVQGTLAPPSGSSGSSGGSGSSGDAGAADDLPLQTTVTAEVNIERPSIAGLNLPAYGYVAGGPATSGDGAAPPPADTGTGGDLAPEAGSDPGTGTDAGSAAPSAPAMPLQEMLAAEVSIEGDRTLPPSYGYVAGDPAPGSDGSGDGNASSVTDDETATGPAGRTLEPLTSHFALPDSIDLDMDDGRDAPDSE